VDIDPADTPMTLQDVKENVEMLIRSFGGKPGVELLGVVHEMLENTSCSCHLDGPSAVVLTPNFARSTTPSDAS
jgi:hypothetical protein